MQEGEYSHVKALMEPDDKRIEEDQTHKKRAHVAPEHVKWASEVRPAATLIHVPILIIYVYFYSGSFICLKFRGATSCSFSDS